MNGAGLGGMLRIVGQAMRWRKNVLECKHLLDSLRPCERFLAWLDDPSLDPTPCWKRFVEVSYEPYTGYQEIAEHEFCPACEHNRVNIVPALKAARKRRGGLTRSLNAAIDRFVRSSNEEEGD